MASRQGETRRYSIDGLDDFPDDGKLRELVDGRIVEWDMPDQEHGRLLALLTILLGPHVLLHRLGVLSSGDAYVRIKGSLRDARGGDIEFFRQGRAPRDRRAAATATVPDFVVEILSPSDRPGDAADKVRDGPRAGVRLLWYIDPVGGSTMVYGQGQPRRVAAADLLDGGELVPGFSVRLRDLLDELAEGSADEG